MNHELSMKMIFSVFADLTMIAIVGVRDLFNQIIGQSVRPCDGIGISDLHRMEG